MLWVLIFFFSTRTLELHPYLYSFQRSRDDSLAYPAFVRAVRTFMEIWMDRFSGYVRARVHEMALLPTGNLRPNYFLRLIDK